MAARSPNVYKLIVMFMYGDYPWLKRLGGGILEFNTRTCAQFIYARADMLRDYMRWLQEHKYITKLEIGYGYCRFKAVPPILFEEVLTDKPGKGRIL